MDGIFRACFAPYTFETERYLAGESPHRACCAGLMSTQRKDTALTISSLSSAYERGTLRPQDVVEEVFGRLDGDRNRLQNVWLHVEQREKVEARATRLEQEREAGKALPLFGIPFAVKDNIDVAGVPTTAGCTAYARTPSTDATVFHRLQAAGALFVGKVNLDQLATGLVGVRSPFGIPTNPFDEKMIPGGSSSGSAVAVAAGHVSFALGTDTAGSGRVPAAFNNVVGLKPTRGVLSTSGVVPACRSLDCVSVFAMTVGDASLVAEAAKGFDPSDPFSRPDANMVRFVAGRCPPAFRFGVPQDKDLDFCGDEEARRCFDEAATRLFRLGGQRVEVDFGPFGEAGNLLYDGPWLAERLFVGQDLLSRTPEALLPVIREILSEATRIDAVTAFRGMYRLEELKRITARTWDDIDVLVVPSTPTIYTVAEVLREPRRLNAHLGRYTNFVNLLDLAALAVPAVFRRDRLPSGITLIGPRGSDATLAALGAAFHRSLALPLGATGHPHDASRAELSDADRPQTPTESVLLAVVGAHLSGLPLNHQLQQAGGVLVRKCRTQASYRLFALPRTSPPKPGMIRVAPPDAGMAIEVEVWSVPTAAFGGFVAGVPAPLSIGTVFLEDGTSVHGFLCEHHALQGAEDISRFGGWRGYLARE
jgi:allophanate hydrolase